MVAKLLPRRLKPVEREQTEPGTHVPGPLEKELTRKIQERQREAVRLVASSRDGPNMPKYQFCSCGRPAKRKKKTAGGAFYKCSQHGRFFVRAARV